MVRLKAFSRLKNVFSRFNPIPSFMWDGMEEIIIPPSSRELLERVINKYPKFKYAFLIALYHLINTLNVKNEYLTVLTKNGMLIADLIKGIDNEVSMPSHVKKEGKKNNILIACHNHFFGAIILSFDDIASTINNNCQFAAIVSCNHIGILINEVDEIEFKLFISDFKLFREYIGFCIENEKGHEYDEIDMMDISEDEREKMKSMIHDKFLSDNIEKFVNEFNKRFNKYKIYELYIKL